MDPVIAAVLAVLEAELADVQRRATDIAEGAVHEESRAEDPKDTRGLEATYLARGLAERVSALEGDIKTLRFLPRAGASPGASEPRITSGVRFVLEDEEGVLSSYVMLPCAGGVEVSVGETTLRVLSPSSPLGKALLGKSADDDVRVQIAGKMREYVVAELIEAD